VDTWRRAGVSITAAEVAAIRASKGQGLWGATISSLCDEVDRLAGDMAAAAPFIADAGERIVAIASERDELFDRVAELESELAAKCAHVETAE